MQLTLYSDYSLRVLIYLAKMPNALATISEISEFYRISRNHLVKVVHQLSQLGYVVTIRGKNGGIRLAHSSNEIPLGEVVRKTEKTFNLVECFDELHNQCVITGHCRLKKILSEALHAYFSVLDRYTLADACDPALTLFIEQVIHFPRGVR